MNKNIRSILWAGVASLVAGMTATAHDAARAANGEPLVTLAPEPERPSLKEGFVDVGGARLYYWDTGGNGEPVVLLHPGTGSAESWAYQQAVFVKAGLRLIGYSRRGFYKSEPSDTPAPAKPSNGEDLHRFLQGLGLSKIHLVGSAAGGFVAAEYAVTHPEMLRTVTIASSMIGFRDEEFQQLLKRVQAPGFNKLPPEFRELGPSYRALNPAGTQRWMEIQKRASHETPFDRVGEAAPGQAPGSAPADERRPPPTNVTYASLAAATSKVPTLMLTGDADLFMPPGMLQTVAAKLGNPEVHVIANAGHAAFWEQADSWNRIVMDFVRRHAR